MERLLNRWFFFLLFIFCSLYSSEENVKTLKITIFNCKELEHYSLYTVDSLDGKAAILKAFNDGKFHITGDACLRKELLDWYLKQTDKTK